MRVVIDSQKYLHKKRGLHWKASLFLLYRVQTYSAATSLPKSTKIRPQYSHTITFL